MMQKVLLIGSDQVWSLERFYLKYFAEEGISVELFAAQNMFYDYNGRSILNKVKLKAGISGIFKSINAKLREKIEAFRPDVVWVFKGMEVLPQTLEWLRAQKIPVANYNPDNPFIFTGAGSGNKNVRNSISLYDLHFTYNLEIKKRLENEYHLPTAFLPFGFELDEEVFVRNSKEPEVLKACFLGNPDEQRVATIKELSEAGVAIDIYGNDWSKYLGGQKNLTIFPAVYENDFWKTLRKYRLQLNLMRIHNEDSHNMRTFEVPGTGGIMLAPATTEHKLFFKDGEEVFLFKNVAECVNYAQRIVALGKNDADRIRDRARKRSVESGYSYKSRAKQALQELRDLYAKTGDHSF
jgi:spore maturation protein CgeB